MKNQTDLVSITTPRGQTRQVNVIRKKSMLRTSNTTDTEQRVKDVFKEPAQVREAPIQIPNIKYDDSELSIFESVLKAEISTFEEKRGSRRGNRHRRVREEDFSVRQSNKPYSRNKTQWSDHD